MNGQAPILVSPPKGYGVGSQAKAESKSERSFGFEKIADGAWCPMHMGRIENLVNTLNEKHITYELKIVTNEGYAYHNSDTVIKTTTLVIFKNKEDEADFILKMVKE
jgi:hypothetical protein